MGIKTSIERIARTELGVENLEADREGSREVSVANIGRALLAAYMAGVEECKEDHDMSEQFIVERDGQPDLRFTGEKIGSTSSSPDNGHPDFSGSTGRWTVLRLYRTDGGKYVCERIQRTQWQGEQDVAEAEVCDTLDGVFSFFGYGRLAKEIYCEADVQAVQTID